MANFIDFKVGGFKVGSIGSVSGVFIGENVQYAWRGTSKTNLSTGRVTGDGNIVDVLSNRVEDPDLLDTWVQKPLPFIQQPLPSPVLQAALATRTRNIRRAHRRKNASW